jgi:hypothetical protein
MRFGGTYRLHHPGDKNQQARNNVSSNYQPKHAAKTYCIVSQLMQETHGVTSQKTAFFIVTAVKTPTCFKWDVFLVRFEVFTVVTMKNGVFLDVTSCGCCKNRRFGGT